jgi:hypothetical protein
MPDWCGAEQHDVKFGDDKVAYRSVKHTTTTTTAAAAAAAAATASIYHTWPRNIQALIHSTSSPAFHRKPFNSSVRIRYSPVGYIKVPQDTLQPRRIYYSPPGYITAPQDTSQPPRIHYSPAGYITAPQDTLQPRRIH